MTFDIPLPSSSSPLSYASLRHRDYLSYCCNSRPDELRLYGNGLATVDLRIVRPPSHNLKHSCDEILSFLVSTMAQPHSRTFEASRDDRPFHHSQVSIDHSALVQSRETGDVLPDDTIGQGDVKVLPFAKSWVHMVAGG